MTEEKEFSLADYYSEVVKTAGLLPEAKVEETKVEEKTASETEDVEMSDEKVEAVSAVAEQFDADGISFESEDEKIASALLVVEGFEEVLEKQASDKAEAEKQANALTTTAKAAKSSMREKLMALKDKAKKGATAVSEHLGRHPKKYIAGAVAGGAMKDLANYKASKKK